MKISKMQAEDVLVSAAEFIKDRLYFVTLRTEDQPRATICTHYFTVDASLKYESFFSDFGPLNISMLFEYCKRLNKKMTSSVLRQKRIVHHTTDNRKTRLNSACLIGCYAIIYLQFSPEKAYEVLNANNNIPFIEFRDASVGDPYTISLLDCLKGLEKALRFGFFSFDNFNQELYEFYERVENGDLNWIVPGKFLGFCGPHNKSRVHQGYPLHAPDFYFDYFQRNKVTTIIRLNKKMYDAAKFINAGFEHHDLYFVDGSTPTDKILSDFISICEKAPGAIAVHCKAGLGRTGTLIGCFLMKHYFFAAKEAIGWIRMCRPGSVIGHQQVWLECKEEQMWKEGEIYRRNREMTAPPKHSKGIYSENDNDDDVPQQVCCILKKVNTMKLNDKEEKSPTEENSSPLTQGDTLNHIKAMRRLTRPLAVRPNNERKTFRTRVLASPVSTPTLLRAGKISPVSLTKTPSSTSRVLTNKRLKQELKCRRHKISIPDKLYENLEDFHSKKLIFLQKSKTKTSFQVSKIRTFLGNTNIKMMKKVQGKRLTMASRKALFERKSIYLRSVAAFINKGMETAIRFNLLLKKIISKDYTEFDIANIERLMHELELFNLDGINSRINWYELNKLVGPKRRQEAGENQEQDKNNHNIVTEASGMMECDELDEEIGNDKNIRTYEYSVSNDQIEENENVKGGRLFLHEYIAKTFTNPNVSCKTCLLKAYMEQDDSLPKCPKQHHIDEAHNTIRSTILKTKVSHPGLPKFAPGGISQFKYEDLPFTAFLDGAVPLLRELNIIQLIDNNYIGVRLNELNLKESSLEENLIEENNYQQNVPLIQPAILQLQPPEYWGKSKGGVNGPEKTIYQHPLSEQQAGHCVDSQSDSSSPYIPKRIRILQQIIFLPPKVKNAQKSQEENHKSDVPVEEMILCEQADDWVDNQSSPNSSKENETNHANE